MTLSCKVPHLHADCYTAGKSNIYNIAMLLPYDFVVNCAELGQIASNGFPEYDKISYNGNLEYLAGILMSV